MALTRSSRPGVGLVEALLASLVAALLFGAVTAYFTQMRRLARDAEGHLAQTLLARHYLDQWRARIATHPRLLAKLPANGAVEMTRATPFAAPAPLHTVQVRVHLGQAGAADLSGELVYRITVTVSPAGPLGGGARPFTLTSTELLPLESLGETTLAHLMQAFKPLPLEKGWEMLQASDGVPEGVPLDTVRARYDYHRISSCAVVESWRRSDHGYMPRHALHPPAARLRGRCPEAWIDVLRGPRYKGVPIFDRLRVRMLEEVAAGMFDSFSSWAPHARHFAGWHRERMPRVEVLIRELESLLPLLERLKRAAQPGSPQDPAWIAVSREFERQREAWQTRATERNDIKDVLEPMQTFFDWVGHPQQDYMWEGVAAYPALYATALAEARRVLVELTQSDQAQVRWEAAVKLAELTAVHQVFRGQPDPAALEELRSVAGRFQAGMPLLADHLRTCEAHDKNLFGRFAELSERFRQFRALADPDGDFRFSFGQYGSSGRVRRMLQLLYEIGSAPVAPAQAPLPPAPKPPLTVSPRIRNFGLRR